MYMQSSAYIEASPLQYSETIFNLHTCSVLAEENLSNTSHEVPAREVMDVERKLHYLLWMRNLYPTEKLSGQILVKSF